MFKSNCHTHTIYCDGKNTAREMIEAAIEKGFVSIGFSGHGPMNDNNEWAMTKESVKEYRRELSLLKKEYADRIDVLCGIELDRDYAYIDPTDFDYVIGSFHQFEKDSLIYEIDYDAERLQRAADELFGGSFNELSRCYFATVADFVTTEKVDVVGHLDLITKFNLDNPLFDEGDETYREIALAAVDKILEAKPDIIFEVNTGAMYRVGKKEPYPAEFLLSYIGNKGGRITLTSDSHDVMSIDFAFDEATKLIKKCGFSEIFYITSDGWKSYKV